MRHSIILLLVSSAAAMAMPAAAQTVAVGITGGTLGVGPEASVRINETFGIRGNATFLSISHGFDSDQVDYHGKVKLKSAGAMVDIYPFGGGFRISGGARVNGNNGRVRATPTGTVTLGDTDYTGAQIGTLRGRAETKNFAPALTIGYGGSNKKGFLFGIEAGALFQDKVRIANFTASGGGVAAADLEAERRDIQHDVDKFKVYPILQISLGYRF